MEGGLCLDFGLWVSRNLRGRGGVPAGRFHEASLDWSGSSDGQTVLGAGVPRHFSGDALLPALRELLGLVGGVEE